MSLTIVQIDEDLMTKMKDGTATESEFEMVLQQLHQASNALEEFLRSL